MLSRTGYTGHQHDRDLGFIDMRGRMYDPLAGRFASADPIIQAPFFSQGLNRYAYVFNDPVNLTDPSGFQVWVDKVFYTADVPSAISDSVYAGAGMSGLGAIGGAGGDPAALMGGAGAGSWGGIIAGGTGLAINATTWSSLPWERTPGHSRTISLGNRAGQTSQATQNPSNAQAQNRPGNIATVPQLSPRCQADPGAMGCLNALSGLDLVGGGVVTGTAKAGTSLLSRLFSWMFGKAAARGLNVIKTPVEGLGTGAARLAFRGPANSVLRGGDVVRGASAGSKRAFVTDGQGRIVREITADRVKVRVSNSNPAGEVFESFQKVGPPTADDLQILRLLD